MGKVNGKVIGKKKSERETEEMSSKDKKFSLINEETQRLNVYHVENMRKYFSNDKSKPSNRIFLTRSGKRAIRGLQIIEKRYNYSWYKVLKDRWVEKADDEAIFYRGNIITGGEMFRRADRCAKALVSIGIEQGDEIACCIANVPELMYLMLGANKVGAKLNFFGSHYDKEFVEQILNGCTDKLFVATDNEYGKIASIVHRVPFKNKVLISLADSLPEHPEMTDGYEPKLDKYYRYENKVVEFIKNDDTLTSFKDFMKAGEAFTGEVVDNNNLDTEFLVTYTSGSTKVGFPKQMIHRNRSLITIGVFHDPELCGNPAVHGLRGMAHLHTDTNTNLITTISDALFQDWSVAMEPEYGRGIFLDYLFLDKPNFALATTNFILEAARQYLVEKRYHSHGVGRKLDFLLVLMDVGEPCAPGEEKFINAFLKDAKAGSGVNLFGPFHLPYVTVGIGGGDTEHGGVYYTLWRKLNEKLHARQLHGQPMGLQPVPYAQVTVLRQDKDGGYRECKYGEDGVIVANSSTTFAGYKNFSRVYDKIVTDNRGISWVSCDVFGHIDKMGNIHIKDRKDSEVFLEDGSRVLPFRIADVVQEDDQNILTGVVTTCDVDGKTNFVINIEYSPLKEHKKLEILNDTDKRLKKAFPEIYDRIVYRTFDTRHPFPNTGSGKRNMVAVQNLGSDYTFRLIDGKNIPVQ